MAIKLEIVEENGEQLFRLDDLRFDLLSADPAMDGGSLKVMRDGQTLTQTTEISEWGAQYRHTGLVTPSHCFLGFDENVLARSYFPSGKPIPRIGLPISGLLADKLEVGDEIEIAVDRLDKKSFAALIRERFIDKVMSVHQPYAKRLPDILRFAWWKKSIQLIHQMAKERRASNHTE